ncbi:AraC family transcriptional regulator [Cellulosilyticum sp. ST5]|uniref:Transcriptional regulator, AraC family n=1 Tax=Cellulosilyticum lentocellum (strain ATCC 49066 / DSM 5427 / NCIMB 11756 / RHM5) TaxID=642492 RepID=F2JGD1_CELLD|nr:MULTISPECIES: AraC family transcriptional regulator [Cellulosilyticum]ADZ81826.1 transcriptional regulator, AraC family [Cellulosilyticum lentocellum DSM 5427]QEH67492.1 helix-turn-helix transcriptional regulator [Cellulosilyticum sp. WCF-2]
MNLSTIGFNYYLDYTMPISVSYDLADLKLDLANDYYKLIFLDAGMNHIVLNGREFILVGPYMLCLNEKDSINISKTALETFTVVFFKPSVINERFTLNSCNEPECLSITEIQDLFYLDNFKTATPITSKILSLSTVDKLTLQEKLSGINEQLTIQPSSFWPCKTRAYLIETLFFLIKPEENTAYTEASCISTHCSQLVLDTIYYLQTHYDQKITISMLTQTLNTNRTTLLSEFKKYTNISLNRYLMQLRMRIATTLLRDTELPILEICERTGFSDISYFSKAFKKEVNYTPSEYRKLNA